MTDGKDNRPALLTLTGRGIGSIGLSITLRYSSFYFILDIISGNILLITFSFSSLT